MELPASEAASSVHDGVESREPSVIAADQASRPPRPTQEHNKSGLAWLGPDPCSGHGPLGGADEAATSATSSETCAMDCTPDTREEEAMLSRLGPQPRKRHWLGLESRQDSGPARESGTDVSVPRRDDPQDTTYTGSKAAEQRILLHMAPRRKPRRRPPPSSRYDQLVLLAEQSAQRRHDALYGPSLGAGLDRTLEAVQQTPVVDSRLDLQAMD